MTDEIPHSQPTTKIEFGLFEATPGMRMIFLPDAPRFTIVAASQDICNYLSLKREAIIGKGVFEAFPSNPADSSDRGQHELEDSLIHLLLYKAPHQLPIQRYDIKNDKGHFTRRYWKVSNHPFLNTENEVAYIIHTTEDITELVEANVMQEKMKGLKQAHSVFLQAPVVIAILRGEDNILELANEDALRLWAKTEAIIGKPMLEAIPELKGQVAYEKIGQVYKTGKLFQATEIPITSIKEGKEVVHYFDLYYKPYFDQGAKTVGGVFTLLNDVTEKVMAKRKEEDIKAEAEKQKRLYETITNNTPDLIYVFDLKYRFTYANKALLDMWGKTWEASIGKGLRENGYEEWHALMHEREIDQIVATKSSVRGEVSFPHAKLGKRVYDYILVPVLNHRGKVDAIAGTTRDITELKLSEQALIESNERFRNLADESPMFVFIIDADPVAPVSYWNKTWLQYTGQTVEEALGRAWDGIIHPDDVTIVMENYVPAFEKKSPYFIPSVRVKRYDGQYRWHSFKGNPRYLPNGEFNGYVGVGFDIHEQKLAEEALKQSEARTRLAVDTAQLGTFEIDVTKQKMIYSARAAEIFGLDGTKKWPYTEFTERIYPEDLPIRNKAHEVAIQQGDLSYEARIVRPDDSIRWIRLNGRYSDKVSTATALIGTIMDITEEKRAAEVLEQKIEERTRELKQVNDQLKQFAYSASHDLQEPLRKINYFLDRLQQNLGSLVSDENKKIIERIHNATGRMRVLIDDLLSYSNTTLGITSEEEVALTSIVKDVLVDMEATLLEQDAKVVLHDLPNVKGDHRQLRQLMQNLISNSLKYHKKEVTPFVTITSQTVQGRDIEANIPPDIRDRMFHLIIVKDNGIGFDPDDAERIFRLFQRLHGKAEYEGTGVGLAIAQKVVENHHGYIWAEGEPGAGASFNVLLPTD